jgi:hypothetical protein
MVSLKWVVWLTEMLRYGIYQIRQQCQLADGNSPTD